jgi:hypothetical protein
MVMEALMPSVWAVFVIIGITAIGFFAFARKIIPGEALKYISSLAIEISLPLFIFTNITLRFDPAASPEWWKLPLWWMLFAVITLVMSLALSMLFRNETRREAAVSLYLYNPTFVPMAIIIGVYGNDSPYLTDVFLFTMFTATFYFSVYKLFFRSSSDITLTKTSVDWKKVFNPLIVVTLLALILTLTGVNKYIPEAVFSITGYIGAMAFPLIMFILGGYVYLDMKNSGKIYYYEIAKYVVAKNVIFPLIILGIIYIIKPDYNVALILALSAAAPPLSSAPVLVGRQNGNSQICNQFLVASFLFSIISIPMVMMILNYIIPN